ncbi:Ig-like domain-containing protein [Flammeovirga aprica]|uniref:PKD domain-containing protein n=1 Tax=Flammeovirga aprica JL-4 TaxID=694437 RepID=A0A7X9RU11_9BACT|nr:PKD domain-containing protein [Flammeovirga aprica]NME68479.1 PKD domain-containing protein [Flammeovirga aprica JL-4]
MFFFTASTINAQTLTHSDNTYFNAGTTVIWTLEEESAGDFTGDPFASDFDLIVKSGVDGSISSEGSSLVSVATVVSTKEYTITIDLTSYSLSNNDEFTLYYENESFETIISPNTYIYDDEDPDKPTFELQSTSLTGQFESSVYYTTETEPIFDVTDVEEGHEIELFVGADDSQDIEGSASATDNTLTAKTLSTPAVYTYYVVVTDEAGNTVTSDDIVIDYADVENPLPVAITDLTIDNNPESSEDDVTKNADVDLKFDGLTVASPEHELIILNSSDEEIARTTVDATTENIILPTLADGTHTVTYYFEDIYGNVSDETDFTFTIDTEAPSILSSTIATGYATNTQLAVTPDGDATTDDVTITFETSEELAELPKVEFSSDFPTVNNPSGNNFNVTKSDLDLSSYAAVPFEITIKDIAGNTATITTTTDGSVVYTFPDIVNKIQTSDALEYCDASSSVAFTKDGEITGGDDSYTIAWEVNIDDAGFNSIGVISEEYTENATLSAGTYEYRRVVYSQGIAFPSNTLKIIVEDNAITNTISGPSPANYFTSTIAEDIITITGNTDPDYTYEWEYSTDGENWSTIASETGEDLTYGEAINTLGDHHFRRKVTDGPCISYSDEVIINLYDPIVNNIQNDGNAVYCSGAPEVQFSTEVAVSGGDGSYTYDWWRKEDTGSDTYASLGVDTESLTDNSSLSTGTYTYKRTITSAGETVDSDPITITVYDEITGNTIVVPAKTVYNGEIATGTIQLNPGTASGGDGALKYQWQYFSGSWQDADASVNYTHNATVSDGTEIKFRRIVTDDLGECESISNEITITSLPAIQNTVAVVGNSKYCETFSSFEIQSTALSGGDDEYTIKWFREKNNEGANELTGETNPNFIETEALTAATYTYTRQVTSGGNTETSDPVVITIDAVLVNEINDISPNIFYDKIPTTFVISSKSVAGGDVNNAFVWEIKVDENNWTATAIVTEDFKDYTEITAPGTYKFRRKLTSDQCGDLYSDEVTVVLYSSLQNEIEVDGGVLAYCETFSSFELKSKTLSGSDGDYTFEWYREKNSEGAVKLAGEMNSNFIETGALTSGKYKYTRKVITASSELTSAEVEITIDALIENEIKIPPTEIIYYDKIPTTFIIENQKVGGGNTDDGYTYVWEKKEGLNNWTATGITTQDFSGYGEITTPGVYKFRRKVTSGACGELYSDSLTVNLYESVQNAIAISGGNNICEGYSSFEIETSTLSGGDGNYTFKWYKKIGDGGSEDLMGGEENENLIVTNSESEGKYTYFREAISAGQTIKSTGVVIKIQGALKNSIDDPVTSVYYGEIPGNAIVINNIEVDGGNNTYTYDWEIYDGSNWNSTGISTQNFSNFSVKITTAGEYKFRRKVTSGKCGSSYSEEKTIILYPIISNSSITLQSAAETCIGSQIFIAGTTPNGGEGNYTYQWLKQNNDDAMPSFSPTTVTTPFYFDDNVSEAGNFTFKRVVTSGLINDDALNNVEDVVVNAAPVTPTLIPTDGSSYSNGAQVKVTLDIDGITTFYCSGNGVVSNGDGSTNNTFYPALAGLGDHTITYHIKVGTCIYTHTSTIRVYDGSQPFTELSYDICETGSSIDIDMTDGTKVNVPDEIKNNYKLIETVLIDSKGDPIFSYGNSKNFTFKPTDGLESDDVGTSKLITLKAIYLHSDPLNGGIKDLSQEILLTFEPTPPIIEDGNVFNYCFDGEAIRKLKTVDAIGVIEWREVKGGAVLETGYEFDPGIVKDESSDITKTYYVTQSINGCSSEAVEVTINSYRQTEVPTLVNPGPFDICEGDPMPTLETDTGDNIKWYFEGELVGDQSTFISDISTEGIDKKDPKKFKVTSTVNDCESDEVEVVVNIIPKPSLPEVAGPVKNYCAGAVDLDDLMVKSDGPSTFTWYSDSELKNVVDGFTSTNLEIPDAPASVDGTQTFRYWVVKTKEGCNSDALQISYDIYENPPVPTLVKDVFDICAGDSPEKIQTTGSTGTIYWYKEKPEEKGYEGPNALVDGAEYTPNYVTSVSTDVQYTYYVAEKSGNDCFGPSKEITVNVYALPDEPTIQSTVEELKVCSGENLPTMKVSGENVKWYTAEDKVNSVFTGETYTPILSHKVVADSTVSYFVTSTSSQGCVSTFKEVIVEIKALPNSPQLVGAVPSYCIDENIADITVTGESNAIFEWYTSETLDIATRIEDNNATLTFTEKTAEVTELDSIHYWVTQTTPLGCASTPLKVSIPVYPTPKAPTLASTNITYCYDDDDNDNVDPIEATGEFDNITWYLDSSLKVKLPNRLLTPDNRFLPIISEFKLKNEDKTVTFYVTDKNDIGCESEPTAVNITVYKEVPLIGDELPEEISYCAGDVVQPIVLTAGENLKWYSEDYEKVAEGLIFIPNISTDVTEEESVYYYVTQTINGCEGAAQEIEIEVNPLPDNPFVDGIVPLCIGELVAPLTAYGEDGATFNWYSNETLTKEVSTAQIFVSDSLAPEVDELTSIDFWVTQTSEDKCTSAPTKVSIPVYPTPALPTLTKTDYYYCYGEEIMEMEAVGSNVVWYNEDFSEIVSNNNKFKPTFSPAESTEEYELIFFVTQKNDNYCESDPQLVTITLRKETLKPVLEDIYFEYCAGEIIQPISSTGENVKWYSDEELKNKVGDGLTFVPQDDTNVTEDTPISYYVTQTIDDCPSEAQKVDIIIYSTPAIPTADAIDPYCEGDEIAPLETNGEDGATFTWYSNVSLTNVVGTSRIVDLGITAPAFTEITNLEYWVVQTSKEGCESEPLKVNVPVYPTPAKPTIGKTSYEYCYGVSIDEMQVEGDRVTWYEDEKLTQIVKTGNAFKPQFIADESTKDYMLTYYVTQKNENQCESEPEVVNITLYKETIAPTLSQTAFEYCSGAILQPIKVEGGVNIKWYSDSDLTNQVGTGNTFTPQDDTNVTDDETINYFYTETLNGCESDYQTVTIIIYNTPTAPSIVGDNVINYCSGDELQPILVLGQSDNLKWYADENLSELLSSHSEFTPTVNNESTSVLSEDYYVTYTRNNCESPATKITVNVNPLPVISLLGITDGDVFCKTDASPVVQALPSNGTLTSSTGVVIRNNTEILLGNSPLGKHTLNYTVTNENNCVDSLLISFTIVDAPKVNFSETILCDSKEVTFYDETSIPADDNLTEILEWRYNFGDNEGGVTLYSAEEAKEYTHTYSATGNHDVTLTIITNQNCSEISYEKTIFINSPPVVQFEWSVSEFGSEMQFKEHLEIVNKDPIEYRHWDFGDGTSSTAMNPKHQYTEVGSYLVTYEVRTEKGCSNILQQEVYVLPHPVLLTEDDFYFQNFDFDDGDWKATANNTNISWEYGIPMTTNFSSTNNAWVTNLDSTYFENEESFLNLPSFDISGLTKPMLSFDMKIDIENGIDGAILQYSLDSGQTWYLLGDVEDPINWYNSQSILADPGNQIFGTNTLSKGWTGTNATYGYESGEYLSVRHQLDNFIGEQHLRLRFAFKSNSAQEYEGLVIDNFFIGNRQKVVLIESMTNAAQEASNRAMSSLGEHLATMESDVLSINYHINLEGFVDDLNKDNQEASSGRKFFYGVTNAPRTIVDGNLGAEPKHTDDFLEEFENNVYQRTLLDPEFSIELNTDNLANTGQLGVSLTSHGTFDAADSEILLHIVMIEKSISGVEVTKDISEHLNVMKSMSPAPGAEGTSFFGRSWNVGSTETVFVDWANASVYNTENVELIVFVQDNVSKEIFQAMSYQLDPSLLTTGIINSTELPTDLEWNIYPNPASSVIQVSTTEFINQGGWEISNINGQKVKEGTFSGNRYSVSVEDLASGVYLIRNTSDGKYLPRTLRFVVAK